VIPIRKISKISVKTSESKVEIRVYVAIFNQNKAAYKPSFKAEFKHITNHILFPLFAQIGSKEG